MPKYKVPPEKPFEESVPAEEPEERFPTIFLPASDSQVQAVDVGAEVEVLVRGFVKSATLAKGDDFPRTEIQVELRETDVYEVDSKGDRSGKEEMGRNEPADLLT